MKEFEKFLDNIKEKYPLYQDKDGYNIGNIGALKVGWEEAMLLILTVFKHNLATEDNDELIDVYKMIEEELKEE